MDIGTEATVDKPFNYAFKKAWICLINEIDEFLRNIRDGIAQYINGSTIIINFFDTVTVIII